MDPLLQDKIKIMWDREERRSIESQESLGSLLIYRQNKSTQIVRTWGKIKATQNWALEYSLWQTLTKTQLELQSDPQANIRQENYHATCEALTDFESEKVE